MTTTTTEQSTEAPAEQVHDVLIKTVVNVKLRRVPGASQAEALKRAEEAVDFYRLFERLEPEGVSYDQLPGYPKVAYVEWAEESTDALVDVVDQNGDYDEMQSVYYEMRVDPNTVNDLDWRPTTGASYEFTKKLRELRDRYGAEDASGGETPAFDGNDSEIEFLRELVELAVNCGLR